MWQRAKDAFCGLVSEKNVVTRWTSESSTLTAAPTLANFLVSEVRTSPVTTVLANTVKVDRQKAAILRVGAGKG